MIPRRARSISIIAVATVVVAGACSSSKSSTSLSLHLPLHFRSTTTTSAPAGGAHAPLAQFSATEAAHLPAPTGVDAAALAALARGALPTEIEVVESRNMMEGGGAKALSGVTLNVSSAPPSVRPALTAAASAARRYPTAADAARAGYRLASRQIPGIGSHWIKWSLVTAPFDPAQPSMLLYAGDGMSARLAGLSYYVESAAAPTGFVAGGAHWHRHIGLCIVHGVLVAEGVTSTQACPGGELLPGRNIWMLHVWVVPGWVNRQGLFAPVNPALCSAARPCSAPLK